MVYTLGFYTEGLHSEPPILDLVKHSPVQRSMVFALSQALTCMDSERLHFGALHSEPAMLDLVNTHLSGGLHSGGLQSEAPIEGLNFEVPRSEPPFCGFAQNSLVWGSALWGVYASGFNTLSH